MSTQINNKELSELRRVGNRLSSYRADIDKMLSILKQLEHRHTKSAAPAGKGNREFLKQGRKEKYKQQIR